MATMPWVLIDTSYLAHRALHSMNGLEFEDFPTGVLYGFFEQLRTICLDHRILSNKVALFLDSRQSYRRRLFPAYKEKRHQDRPEEEIVQMGIMKRQMKVLTETVLPSIGFPLYRQTGCESDDVIAQAAGLLTTGAMEVGEQGRTAVIVTADGDLYQCISDAVHWYDPARDLYLDVMGFIQKKLVDPSSWAAVKALAGCHTDCVPGIPGVGEGSAVKFLMHLLPTHHKRYKDINSPHGVAIYKRNLLLVTLPFHKTKKFSLRLPEYNPKAFFEFCKDFGMKSYLEGKRKREWGSFFSGNLTSGQQMPRKRGEKRG